MDDQTVLHYTFTPNQEKNYNTKSYPNIMVFDNVLSDKECADLIALTNHTGRYNVQFEDLSNILLERLKKELPKLIFIEDPDLNKNPRNHHNNNQYWALDKINHHWKYYKKDINSKLTPHYDGICVHSVDYKSIYSILVYLENSDGALHFVKEKVEIMPKKGRVVVFNMKLLHEGLENKEYHKIFLRSKLMYTRCQKIENENDKKAALLYSEALTYKNSNYQLFQEEFDKVCLLSPQFEKNLLNLL